MPTGIGCHVLADGKLLLDGSTDPGTSPVVLSGLEVAWGRETTVDQPEASTCTFEIDDPVGGRAFLDQLRTGTRIDVLASGSIYPDPTEPVWPDPGFETALPGTTRSNALVSRSTRRSSSGTYSLRLDPVDASRRATVIIAPAPYSTPGDAPDAWDAIPTTAAGQTWSYGATIYAPPGAQLLIRPVLFAGPYAGMATVVNSSSYSIAGDGDWHTFTQSFVPTISGAWVGLQVSSYPTGWTWDQVPPTWTWDSLAPDPTTVLTNLFTNPSFELGTTGVLRTSAILSIVQEAAPSAAGAYSLEVTATDAPTAFTGVGQVIAVTAGQWVASAFAVLPAGASYRYRVRYLAYDDAGAQIGASAYSDYATVAADTWATVPGGSWQAPDGAVSARAYLYVHALDSDTPPAGAQYLTDAWIAAAAETAAEAQAALDPYFDGDTPDTDTTTFAWTDAPNASTSTATPAAVLPADWTWDDFGAVFVDDVSVLAPAEGTISSVLVYSGRIVSLEASWDDGPVVKLSCVDFTADMDNIDVGEQPWAVESMSSRFQRIIAATGMGVTADIDESVAGILVSWRDVDASAATGLLAELADSVDAVMWSATHAVTGPYLRVEDPTNRPSVASLQLVDGVVTVVANPDIGPALKISACDVLRDDVEWTQDVQDVVTRAAVSWQEQGVDDEGKTTTTERTVTLVDEPAEAQYGARSLSLSTQLQAEADAAVVADKILARTSISGWRASGLVIDDATLDDATEDDINRLLTLLDGTSRNGLALNLVDLPSWSPTGPVVGVYLEGGKYTFEDGVWVLDLTVSNATAQGASATWDDLDPTWTWDQFDPAMTWDDLRGVGVAPVDQPIQQGA